MKGFGIIRELRTAEVGRPRVLGEFFSHSVSRVETPNVKAPNSACSYAMATNVSTSHDDFYVQTSLNDFKCLQGIRPCHVLNLTFVVMPVDIATSHLIY